jgi:hypothetical protein
MVVAMKALPLTAHILMWLWVPVTACGVAHAGGVFLPWVCAPDTFISGRVDDGIHAVLAAAGALTVGIGLFVIGARLLPPGMSFGRGVIEGPPGFSIIGSMIVISGGLLWAFSGAGVFYCARPSGINIFSDGFVDSKLYP